MNDITMVEPVARKAASSVEAFWKPKAADFEQLTRLQAFLEEDRKTKIQLDAPVAASDCCSPVQAVVSWTRPAHAQSFRADIDGRDVTGQFQVDEAGMRATATLDLEGGANPTLTASVEMFRWLPQPGMKRMEATVAFRVNQPLWDLSVNSTVTIEELKVVDVCRGSTAAIRVVMTPRQCTTPALIVKGFTSLVLPMVPGFTFTNMPLTVAKGAGYGILTLKVDPTAATGLQWACITASTPEDDAVGTASSMTGFYLNVL